MTEFETDYLAHHGIKGQKWGVRRTPEELGHRLKGSQKPKTSLLEKAKQNRERKREKESQESREVLKNYLRKHPKKLPRYGKALSQEEVNDLIKEIEFDRKLKSIRDDEIRAGWRKIDDMQKNVQTLYNLANNSKNLYNTAAEINNTLVDTGVIKNGKKWAKVGQDNKVFRGTPKK